MESKARSIDKTLIILGIFFTVAIAFWIVANTIGVYNSIALGVIFEILWLPMIAITLAVPIFAFVKWGINRFRLKSWYLLIAITSVTLIAVSLLY